VPGAIAFRSFRAPVGLAAALALIAAAAGPVASARAESAKVGGVYSISFGGIPFAEGKLSLVVEGDAYSAKVSMRPAALARIFSSETVDAEASGWLRAAAVQPARYTMNAANSEKSTYVRIGLSAGTVKSVDAWPRLKLRADTVPVETRHWRGVLDPVSAVVMKVKDADAALGPAACARTLPVYDGWTRFDIPLSYKGMQTVDTRSYHGQVVKCAARWVPVAGHRRNKESVRFMQNNRDLEIWLAPVGGTGILVPYRVSVGTMRGTLVLEARDIKMSGPKVTSASAAQ
jgi:hypothetical protein